MPNKYIFIISVTGNILLYLSLVILPIMMYSFNSLNYKIKLYNIFLFIFTNKIFSLPALRIYVGKNRVIRYQQ